MKKKRLFIIICIVCIAVSLTSCGYYEDDINAKPAVTTVTTGTSNTQSQPVILAKGKCGDSVNWNIDNNGLLTIYGNGKMYDYDVNHPSPFKGGVVLNGKYTINKIVIQSGITSIGNYSLCYFRYRPVNLTMPNSIKTIGEGAFYESSLIGSGKIPNGVISIGDYAFYNSIAVTNLSITLPNTVKTIGNCAFQGCPQDSIIIPKSVTSIGNNAFSITERIDVESGNTSYISIDGILYNYEKTEMIYCPTRVKGNINLPNGIKKIEPFAFSSRDGITSITIPGSVEYIGYNAFDNCFLLKSVIILDGVKSIGNNAFRYCDSLTSIIIPKSVINFGEGTYHVIGFWSSMNLTVYCYKDSEAEKYARNNGYKYVCIPTDERLAGKGRFETAVEISKASFPDGSKTVVLAYGLNYADALAGVSLAKAINAPILLTNLKALPKETLEEIQRLGATDVIILGGTGAVGAEVETALKKEGLKTERIAGGTRFETATKIAEKMQALNKDKAPEDVFFVYAFNSADALSVSAVAAVKGAPVIYLKTKGELDDATAAYLASVKGKVKNAYVIGGSGVISDEMMKKAGDAVGVKATRVFGANRFETCVAVNEKFASVLDGDSICVATGMDFPDALAGGVFAALNRAPLFLVNGKVKTLALSDTQKSYLKTKAPQKLYVFGGTGAVPDSHVQTVAEASV